MKIPKFLTQTEFEQTIKTMRTSARTRAISHAVLVKRYTVRAVANEYKISFQRVWQIAQRVYQKFMDIQEITDNWNLLQIYLPERYAKQVQKLSRDLREKTLMNLIRRKGK